MRSTRYAVVAVLAHRYDAGEYYSGTHGSKMLRKAFFTTIYWKYIITRTATPQTHKRSPTYTL